MNKRTTTKDTEVLITGSGVAEAPIANQLAKAIKLPGLNTQTVINVQEQRYANDISNDSDLVGKSYRSLDCFALGTFCQAYLSLSWPTVGIQYCPG